MPALKASLMSNRMVMSGLTACLLVTTMVANLTAIRTGHAASLFAWRDANGVQQYSDTCPAGEECEVKRIGVSGQAPEKLTPNPQHVLATNGNGSGNNSTANGSDARPGDGSADSSANGTSGKINIGEVTFTGDVAADHEGNGVGLLLAWKELAKSDAVGYRVYFAPAGSHFQPTGQGVNVGNATSYVITAVTSGTRYYFKITAYDASGNERAFSNTVYKDVP